jgi:hypothetical protein
MRLAALLFGAVLTALSVSAASAAVRITGDTGGIIDGPCLSACTMVLGVIPPDRICVTRRARLGFHAAWHHGENGRPATNRGGTQLLMAVYPQNVKKWIAKRGGLTREMKYLTGRELTSMYRTCR